MANVCLQDLLISRLLTGRIVLSEATVGYTRGLLRHSWAYCVQRELWKGRKPTGPLMSTMPLIKGTYRDYSRSLAIVAKFIETTRIAVAAVWRLRLFFFRGGGGASHPPRPQCAPPVLTTGRCSAIFGGGEVV